MGMLDRFKRRKEPPKPFLRAEDANALNAESVAAALGLAVQIQGRHVELENGMRGTYQADKLVWCHHDGTGIGDNCALVMDVAGLPFRESLELLLGVSTALQPIRYAPPPPKALSMPPAPSSTAVEAGRAYLRSRGVSDYAMQTAEACGMLRYTAGAVLFVGVDADKKPRSVTRRGYTANDPTPKRDLAGSDKAYPPIVPGLVGEVWVVEGGLDALAILTKHGVAAPNIIVSGGVNVTRWLENPEVCRILSRAWRCTVAGENEKNAKVQQENDEQREALMAKLKQHVPDVALWMPPAGVKDLGELLTITPKSTL